MLVEHKSHNFDRLNSESWLEYQTTKETPKKPLKDSGCKEVSKGNCIGKEAETKVLTLDTQKSLDKENLPTDLVDNSLLQTPAKESYSHLQTPATNADSISQTLAKDPDSHSHSQNSAKEAQPQTLPQPDSMFTLALYPDLPPKYRLEQLLGEGAFSSVYKGCNTQTGESVAIKIINKQNLTPKQLGNTHNEIHIMNTLANAGNHPNVLRMIELFDEQDNSFLILEYCDGGEIFNKIIDFTYFSEALARHVFVQLVDAIGFLHEHNVVHRDIKPENLLFRRIPQQTRPESEFRAALRKSDDALKRDEGRFVPGVGGGGIGTVKLADFGLAKLLRFDPKVASGSGHSNLKTPCGTAGYTAPEVIHCGVERRRRFKSSTSKSNYYLKAVDIWSLGCLLYTMLCGFPPFYDDNHDVLTHKIITADYVFLAPWWDEISADAKDLVSRMLVVNPELRITIDEIYSHPWMADAVAPQPLSYFPEHLPVSSSLHGLAPPKTPVSPGAGGLVSPGIAIKQVFSNPAMLHVNLLLLAQIQHSEDVDPHEVKFDGKTKFSVRSKRHMPRTPNPIRKVNFKDVFEGRREEDGEDEEEDDDYDFDDEDEEEEVADDEEDDDLEFGDTLGLKYLSISSTSSTDSLKLMHDDDTRSLLVISGRTDFKFTLNLNDLSLLRRRLSTKSGHHT